MKDSTIVDLFYTRDEAAIEAVRTQYGKYCRKIAMNVLGSEEDAEECLNDAFLALWDRIPPERPQSLRAFLGKITRNIAVNRYHQSVRKKRGGGEMALVLDELSECLAAPTSVEEEVLGNELMDAINRFLRTLSERDCNIFLSRYFYMDAVKEIAARHGFKEDYVRVVLSRTRNKLKKYLEEQHYL